MKYLFIVQGEGRGHLTQAISLSNLLRENNHQVVGVLVGKSRQRVIPDFFYEKIGAQVKTYYSPNFVWNKSQTDVKIVRTIVYNMSSSKLKRFNKSMEMIHNEIEQSQPDVVINFYEILAGLTKLRFNDDVPFISIAHQFLIMHNKFSFAKGNEQGKLYLRLNALLCSIGSVKKLALSFYPMKDSFSRRIAVVPPLLRQEVLELVEKKEDYILGYIASNGFAEQIIKWHNKNPQQKLHIFWDKKGVDEELKISENLTFHKIDDKKFLQYMANCKAYITTAGFESVCEAIYLNKPILMIPAHIEQEINALDAVMAGYGIAENYFDINKIIDYSFDYDKDNKNFREWVDSYQEVYLRHLTSLL